MVYTSYESKWNKETKYNYQFMIPITTEEFEHRRVDLPGLVYDPMYQINIHDFRKDHAATTEELYNKLTGRSPEAPVAPLADIPPALDVSMYITTSWNAP